MANSCTINQVQSEPFISNRQLEHFMWKLLTMSMLVYFIWGGHLYIQLGPFSIESGRAGERSNISRLDIFHTAESRRKISMPDGTYSIAAGMLPDTAILQCKRFVKQFSPVAIAEMRRFNIPASILLAEAILASDAGTAAHLSRTNNYFNLVCNDRQCAGKHYVDPNTRTRLEVYPMIWSSFRARSLELTQNQAFSGLCAGSRKDFKSWAGQLGQVMQAQDPDYALKIATIIERLNLEYFDRNF